MKPPPAYLALSALLLAVDNWTMDKGAARLLHFIYMCACASCLVAQLLTPTDMGTEARGGHTIAPEIHLLTSPHASPR